MVPAERLRLFQEADIVAFRRDEDMRLPADLDYRAIGGLSNEAKEKLSTVRPATPSSPRPAVSSMRRWSDPP